MYPTSTSAYTSSTAEHGRKVRTYEHMTGLLYTAELGLYEATGLAAGGGLGALLAHGYLKWLKPWLKK